MSLADDIKGIIFDESRIFICCPYCEEEFSLAEEVMVEGILQMMAIRIMKAISQRLIDGVKDDTG